MLRLKRFVTVNFPGDSCYFPSAKIKYNRTLDKWQLYWMRRDLK
ncbi:DUF3024 domain-containing protein [Escherichia fergusonii]|nr:DUF3024 domain-containing protein [Escherichia fergusonii]EHG6170158.1 DUF3024 domain-containing protein [Escherichia fergusonii]HDW3137719.1 DUF3024 domain-containing protein [Escherichia fergusonii]